MPSFAQGQQPNAAKLKADARNLVGLIGGDKAKTQAYCQILDLIAQLNREKDSKKAKALSQKIDQLQKNSIPNFLLDRNLFIRWRSRAPRAIQPHQPAARPFLFSNSRSVGDHWRTVGSAENSSRVDSSAHGMVSSMSGD